jgi:[ribosomal protein S5]-alanine N-acetyltransferase
MIDFSLRAWHKDDVKSLAKYANNLNIAKNMTDGFPFPYTEETAKNFIKMTQQFKPNRFFAIVVNKEAIGGIGIHPQTDIQRKNAELGYWLAEEFWGNGIIYRAILEINKYAFENFDINRIFARPFATNLASQKVLQKAGFKFECKFEKTLIKNDELIDEMFFSVRR